MSALTNDIVSLVGKAMVPAVVLLSFAYFRKRFPARALQMTPAELEELDRRFKRVKYLPTLCMIAVGVAFCFGSHAILAGLNRLAAGPITPSSIRLLPQSAIWWFFPGFGALSLSWEITLQLWARGDRKTAMLYNDWSMIRAWGANGMDSRRVLLGLGLLVVLPIGLFTVLALPMHATVGPESIRDCGYAFRNCQVYPLAGARRITAIEGFRNRDGSLTHRAGLVIDFSDGRRWSSAEWGDFKPMVDPALGALLVRTTGLPIESAICDADIPPLTD
jgi:hypothetical protein